MHIISHIEGIEMYIVQKYPLGATLHAAQDIVPIHVIVSWKPFVEIG